MYARDVVDKAYLIKTCLAKCVSPLKATAYRSVNCLHNRTVVYSQVIHGILGSIERHADRKGIVKDRIYHPYFDITLWATHRFLSHIILSVYHYIDELYCSANHYSMVLKWTI